MTHRQSPENAESPIYLLALAALTAGCASNTSSPAAASKASGLTTIHSAPAAHASEPTSPSAHNTPIADSTRVKVERLLKSGRSQWLLTGEVTSTPAMCLVVLRDDWPKFSRSERVALRPLIQEKIDELQVNPAKYVTCKEGAPLWDFVVSNVRNTTSAVMLSDRKVSKDGFEMSEQINDFDGVAEKSADKTHGSRGTPNYEPPVEQAEPNLFVVLGSWPAGSKTEPRRVQRLAKAHSIEAEVVNSNSYVNFRKGLTVVVSGPWTQEESARQLAKAKRFVKDAYLKAGW